MLDIEINIALYCDGEGCMKSVQYIGEDEIMLERGYLDGSYVTERQLEKWGWEKDPHDDDSELCPECCIKAVADDPEAVEVPVGYEAEMWRKAMLARGHKLAGG